MTHPRILVTSAAGRTGSIATMELLKHGYPVRAFVRRDDDRAAQLRNAGAELFIGDQFDFRDINRAMNGVQRAYHCPPFAPNLLHNAMLFALAAEENRLEAVALMSGWNPHPTHPSLLTREHWLANNLFRWMPNVGVIHINPGLFAFTYLLSLPLIANLGVLLAPLENGMNAPPSNEDIGRVAAAVLMKPEQHIGKCYRPTGPNLLSPTDIANVVGEVLGRKVRYQDSSLWMFSKAATAMGFPLFEIANVRHYFEELRAGAFAIGAPTEHVLLVTGQEPESFKTTVERYISNPSLISPGLSRGTLLGTMALLTKTMLTPAPNVRRWEQIMNIPVVEDAKLAHEDRRWREHAEKFSLYLLDQRPTICRAALAESQP